MERALQGSLAIVLLLDGNRLRRGADGQPTSSDGPPLVARPGAWSRWGDIAHVWSTYESRHAKSDKPFERGINSFQLFNDGKRWWVLNIAWQNEDPEHPIPEKYLSNK